MEKLNMKEKQNYEIVKKWVDGKISLKRAMIILDYTERHMYRLKHKYKEKGKEAFIHGNRGRQPKISKEKSLPKLILQYYKEEFQDFNFKHYQKMLKEIYDIEVSYSYIYNILTVQNHILSPKARRITKKKYKKIELLKKKANKNKSTQEINKLVNAHISLEEATPSLPRSTYFGLNIEMDASSYIYFGKEKTYLHLGIDSATDTATGGYLDYQETLNGYYHVTHQTISNFGIPVKFTSDGRTIFEYMSKRMKTDEKAYFTQFKYACNTLGIDINVTSKPQKKARVEKYNATFQDRLSKELHYYNITNIEDANKYLIEKFIPAFNEEFSLPYKKENNVFEIMPNLDDLNFILAVLSIRTFNNGNTISYKGKTYLPYDLNGELVPFRSGTECTVIEAFDKKLYIQIYNEIYFLKELQETLNYDQSLDDYFETKQDCSKQFVPIAKNRWDKNVISDAFEEINKEHNIYDSHNPKV